MARYVIPSVTISALYSAYHYHYSSTPQEGIRSIDQAVWALNRNENTQEAIRFIQEFKHIDTTFLSHLTPASLGRLAQRGSGLCSAAPVSGCHTEYLHNFEEILIKFDLGDEWNNALAWLNRVACPEEDLACSEEWLTRRPSQVERLLRVIQLLFLKTEDALSKNSISKDVIPFLHSLYKEFRDTNAEIALLSLKTLSNLAIDSVEFATLIFTSQWLPLLSNLVQHGKTLEERLVSHKICQNALSSLGVVDYRLHSDVYELYLPDKEPEVDIVMIHGLRGSVGYTWRQNDSAHNIVTECWPKDWLPLDIQNPFRIIGLDYPSYIIQFTGTMESLQVRADRFKKQLEEAGIGRRPVVFICHSMGGLLAKRLLLDLPHLTEQTVGILFIATPHRGSPIAAWGYEILHPTEDVRFLHEGNPLNKKLNDDFSPISSQIPVIVSMVETKASDLIGTAKGIIVPTQSAVFDKGAVYHIEEVHHNVCKPSERSSPAYGVVINFLKDCLKEAGKMTATKKEEDVKKDGEEKKHD